MGLNLNETLFCQYPIMTMIAKHLYSTYYAPAFVCINPFNLIPILCGEDYYYLHFTDKNIEPHSFKITCSNL